MKTSAMWKLSGLVMVALFAAVGCSTQEPAQPPSTSGTSASASSAPASGDSTASTRFHVQALTKDGEPMELGDWTVTSIPDAPVGGVIFPLGVCNTPSFVVTEAESNTWVIEKTGGETEELCSDEESAIKAIAVDALVGRLTIEETTTGLELTNPPYTLSLERGD